MMFANRGQVIVVKPAEINQKKVKESNIGNYSNYR